MGNSGKWIAANRRFKLWILVLCISLLAASCSQETQITQATPTDLDSITQASTAVLPTVDSPSMTAPVPQGIAATPDPTSFQSGTIQASPTITITLSTTAAPSQAASVTTFPDASKVSWATVVDGLDSPVGMANAGDGSNRLFILERAGRIRLIAGGQLQTTPYLDITDRVGSRGSEQGLLGIAFHPDFQKNGYFYLNYTDFNGNTQIARFHADPASNQAEAASQYILLTVRQPFPNHNGGGVVFGPDGNLYLGLGDGGSQGDPNGNGQALDTYLGKILRIDVNGSQPYIIPPDNPFIGKGLPEIWAFGLRNPWRFDFDPLTHELFIGDVGQDAWEEIDYLPAGSAPGANFGWNYREGNHDYRGNPPPGITLVNPVYEYSHAEGGCSVTGGVVYRGQLLPAWQGIYLFGDYCSGKIWGLLRDANSNWQAQILFDTQFAITSFGRDEQGEVYLVDQRGSVDKLISSGS